MIERRAGFCTAFFSKIEGEQMEQGKSRLAQEFEKKEEGGIFNFISDEKNRRK